MGGFGQRSCYPCRHLGLLIFWGGCLSKVGFEEAP